MRPHAAVNPRLATGHLERPAGHVADAGSTPICRSGKRDESPAIWEDGSSSALIGGWLVADRKAPLGDAASVERSAPRKVGPDRPAGTFRRPGPERGVPGCSCEPRLGRCCSVARAAVSTPCRAARRGAAGASREAACGVLRTALTGPAGATGRTAFLSLWARLRAPRDAACATIDRTMDPSIGQVRRADDPHAGADPVTARHLGLLPDPRGRLLDRPSARRLPRGAPPFGQARVRVPLHPGGRARNGPLNRPSSCRPPCSPPAHGSRQC
jgi:hypothetical protein